MPEGISEQAEREQALLDSRKELVSKLKNAGKNNVIIQRNGVENRCTFVNVDSEYFPHNLVLEISSFSSGERIIVSVKDIESGKVVLTINKERNLEVKKGLTEVQKNRLATYKDNKSLNNKGQIVNTEASSSDLGNREVGGIKVEEVKGLDFSNLSTEVRSAINRLEPSGNDAAAIKIRVKRFEKNLKFGLFFLDAEGRTKEVGADDLKILENLLSESKIDEGAKNRESK